VIAGEQQGAGGSDFCASAVSKILVVITSVYVRRGIHGNIVHHIMGARTLDKVFYLIPDVEAEVQSLELLNYAQITVVWRSHIQRHGT
jgi:hypothetical protein